MTNKERYQRTFSALHASNDCMMEGTNMKKTKRTHMPRLVAVCAAVALALGLASFAYAADIGGIQRSVQIWLYGDQTDAVLEVIRDGEYTLTYEDAEGNPHQLHGGGIAIEPDGTERALTEEEFMEELNMPEVDYAEDGSVWVYYHSQKVEITDKFDEDGICYVLLKDGGDNLYMTVKYDNGYSMSPNSYPSPRSFNR